ncbi:uncharacterized protein LOC129600310 [Paramacrobiotus metropolitanus]|uniref:uncharacterized protein LOC129600310 n=1 Tax=Paramacrobiotus metropolitanus TaxID=2943436 RepID=UPI0024465243|nr:uncharacterized protein LOC129600310 [Paramacrobiotus metropolitanus]
MWTLVGLIALTFTRSAALRSDGQEFRTTDDDYADDPRTVSFPADSALFHTESGVIYPASRNIGFGSLLGGHNNAAAFNDESDAALSADELALKAAETVSLSDELKTKEFVFPMIQDSMQRGRVQIPAIPQLFRGPTIFGFTAKNVGRKTLIQKAAGRQFLLQKLANAAFMPHQFDVVPDSNTEEFTPPDNSLSTFSLSILGNSPLMRRSDALFDNGLSPIPMPARMRKQRTSMAARLLRKLAQSQLENIDSSGVEEAAPEPDRSPFFQPEAHKRLISSEDISKLPSEAVPLRLPHLQAHGVPLSSGLIPDIIFTASSRKVPEMDNENFPSNSPLSNAKRLDQRLHRHCPIPIWTSCRL